MTGLKAFLSGIPQGTSKGATTIKGALTAFSSAIQQLELGIQQTSEEVKQSADELAEKAKAFELLKSEIQSKIAIGNDDIAKARKVRDNIAGLLA